MRSRTDAGDLIARSGPEDIDELATRKATALATGEADVARLREQLRGRADVVRLLGKVRGWTPEAIARLGLGFDGERITFAGRDEDGHLVGLIRYQPNEERRNGTRKMLAEAAACASYSQPRRRSRLARRSMWSRVSPMPSRLARSGSRP